MFSEGIGRDQWHDICFTIEKVKDYRISIYSII